MPINIYPHSVKIKQSNEYANATKILGLEHDAEVLENLNNKQTEIIEILQNKKEAINNSLNELSSDYVNYMGTSKSTVISEITSSATSAVDDYINNRISYEYYVTPQRFKQPGETDDAKAINAAIDYAVKNKCIVRLKGTYYCKTPIYCRTNTSLIGTGLGRVNWSVVEQNTNKTVLDNTETIIESSANPVIAIYGRYVGEYAHNLEVDKEALGLKYDSYSVPTRGQVHLKNLNIRSRNFDGQLAENPSDEIKNTQINRRKSQIAILLRPHSNNGTTWKNFFQRCNIRGFGIGVKFDNNKDDNNYEDCSSENLFLHCKIYDCAIGVQCLNNQSVNNTFIQTDIQAVRAPMGPAIDVYSGGGLNFYGCSIMNRGEVLKTNGLMKHCIINMDSCRIEDISNGENDVYGGNGRKDALHMWDHYEDKLYVPTPSYLFGVVNPRFTISYTKNNNTYTVTITTPYDFPEQMSKVGNTFLEGSGLLPYRQQDVISPYFKSDHFNKIKTTVPNTYTDYYVNNDAFWTNNTSILSLDDFSFQWEQYSKIDDVSAWRPIDGATTNSFTITQTENIWDDTDPDFRKYRCKIMNNTPSNNENHKYKEIKYLPDQGCYTNEFLFKKQPNSNEVTFTQPSTFYVYGNAGSSQSVINITNCMILMHNWTYKKYLFYANGKVQANINNIFVDYNSAVTKLELAKTEAYNLITGRKKLAYAKINASNIFNVLPSKRDITGTSGEYIGSIKQMNIFCNQGTSEGWQKLPINYDINGFSASCGSLNFIKFGRNNINAGLSDTGYQNYAFELPPYLTLVKIGIRHYGTKDSEVILQAINDDINVTSGDNPNLIYNDNNKVITIGRYFSNNATIIDDSISENNIATNVPTVVATINQNFAKAGDSITLTATTYYISSDSNNPITYQWQFNNPANNNTWQTSGLSGSDTNNFQFSATQVRLDGRQYRCAVTQGNQTWYSNYIKIPFVDTYANINIETGIIDDIINITVDPVSNDINDIYQWQISKDNGTNWNNITNVTTNILTFGVTKTIKNEMKNKIYRCAITHDNTLYYSNSINISQFQQIEKGKYSQFYLNNIDKDVLLTGSKEGFKSGHYFLKIKRSDLCDVYLYYI